MAKKFDVYFDKTTSYDIDLESKEHIYNVYCEHDSKHYDIELKGKEHVYNVYLGRDSKQTDIFIESLPLHTVVEPAENIYLIIDSGEIEVEVFGSLTPDINYICLDSSVAEKAHKYEYDLSNDVCVEYDTEGCLIKIAQPNGSGIEMDMEASFVLRRLRYLYDLDSSTLRSFETQTLEELTYIIVPI